MLRLCSDSSRLRAEALQRAGTFLSGEACLTGHPSLMARLLVTVAVMGQESAEAIVGEGRRCQAMQRLETSPAQRTGTPYPVEGPNVEEGKRPNELS